MYDGAGSLSQEHGGEDCVEVKVEIVECGR